MPTTLGDLAALVGGRLVGGSAERSMVAAATLETAGTDDLSFLDAADKLHLLAKSRAGAVIVPVGIGPLDRPSIEVADVHVAFTAVIEVFRPKRHSQRTGVSPQAVVDATAHIASGTDIHPFVTVAADVEIGPDVTIHPGVHLMAGCRIGAGSVIFPNAVLYENTVVGERCIIHAGAVLGGYGFGYKAGPTGYAMSAQLGWVELAADVEIGANTTIDRGTYGATVIGTGTKIDNLVMIAHNCRLGRHNMICSQVGVAGSTTTGDWVVMAGQVGVRDHVHIGDKAILGARSGVSNDIEAGKIVLGEPAIDLRDRKLQLAALSKLPDMRRDVKQLAARVTQLEGAPARPAADAA